MLEKRRDRPIPEPRGKWHKALDSLEVGEYIFVPVNHNMGSTLTLATKRTGSKFTRERATEGSISGLRIFRVE